MHKALSGVSVFLCLRTNRIGGAMGFARLGGRTGDKSKNTFFSAITLLSSWLIIQHSIISDTVIVERVVFHEKKHTFNKHRSHLINTDRLHKRNIAQLACKHSTVP